MLLIMLELWSLEFEYLDPSITELVPVVSGKAFL